MMTAEWKCCCLIDLPPFNEATFEELLADYPCLERDDIPAAIAYAAQQTNHVVVKVS